MAQTKEKPTKTLKELRAEIQRQVAWLDRKPFSDNIISITLKMIADGYGKEEANKAIGDFKLDKKGWSKE